MQKNNKDPGDFVDSFSKQMGQTFHITSSWLKNNKTRGSQKKTLCGFFVLMHQTWDFGCLTKHHPFQVTPHGGARRPTPQILHVERSNKMHDLRVDKRHMLRFVDVCVTCSLLKNRDDGIIGSSFSHWSFLYFFVLKILKQVTFFPKYE